MDVEKSSEKRMVSIVKEVIDVLLNEVHPTVCPNCHISFKDAYTTKLRLPVIKQGANRSVVGLEDGEGIVRNWYCSNCEYQWDATQVVEIDSIGFKPGKREKSKSPK